MLFNSLEFGFFFALVFGVTLLLPLRAQNRWLLLASYVFYAAWDWRFLGLLALSTTIDYWVARAIHQAVDSKHRRALLASSVVSNLGILGLFKYADFFGTSLSRLLGTFGVELQPFLLEVVLPVGISFYTFQTLSYTIDVYRRRMAPTHDFLDFALFVSFFPQLVAGPIERASRLLPQIGARREITMVRIQSGSWLILWGLFKKVVIGDNLAPLIDAVFAPAAEPYAPEVLLATYAFAVQIYCDFSGYTDIARGLAQCLGFELMLNFDLPYLARNPSEFWRRWHISLSTWLRDYLYISLGGNRHGRWRTYRNLLLTMLLGGLWHGAAWHFVAWGGYHGLLLGVHRACRGALDRLTIGSATRQRAVHLLSTLFTFHLVCLGWLLFRADSLSHALSLVGRFGGPWHVGLASAWLLPLTVLAGPLLLMQLAQAKSGKLNVVQQMPLVLRAAVYAGLFLVVVVFGEDFGRPFIYFQF
jgi:D-alanyl-lipoteichoic acid acyltransferase DltB (MBOAT superfamily)